MFNYHTVHKIILGDLITPVSAYMKVRDDYPQSALMESSDYHSGENSRSFIALHPIASVAISHGKAICNYPDGSSTVDEVNDHFTTADAINQFLRHFTITGEKSNYCGLYGYTSFNAVRYFENINIKDETQQKNDAPDMLYILYKDVVVFDHFSNTLTIIELMSEGEEEDLDQLEKDLTNREVRPYDFQAIGDTYSTLTDDEHRENIRRGIAHCKRGDVFQVVLSRRFIQKYEGDDLIFTAPCEASIHLPISSISTSVDSAFLVPVLRHTVGSKAKPHTSTPSQERPSEQATLTRTVRMHYT